MCPRRRRPPWRGCPERLPSTCFHTRPHACLVHGARAETCPDRASDASRQPLALCRCRNHHSRMPTPPTCKRQASERRVAASLCRCPCSPPHIQRARAIAPVHTARPRHVLSNPHIQPICRLSARTASRWGGGRARGWRSRGRTGAALSGAWRPLWTSPRARRTGSRGCPVSLPPPGQSAANGPPWARGLLYHGSLSYLASWGGRIGAGGAAARVQTRQRGVHAGSRAPYMLPTNKDA